MAEKKAGWDINHRMGWVTRGGAMHAQLWAPLDEIPSS